MMQLVDYIKTWLETFLFEEKTAAYLLISFQLIMLAFIAIVVDLLTRKIILQIIRKLISRSKTNWDDMLFNRKVFHKLAHVVPALVVQYLITIHFTDNERLILFLHNAMNVYIIFVSMQAISSFINGLHDIYLTMPVSKDSPIKSYIQIAIIIIYFIGAILILSVTMDREVKYFFTGLGAIAAVLMLVFKDSIMGLVGGIQLSANDMVRPGDWIEMPSRKADGDVIDISLHTVKVQNWDKTITTIPTYALVNESFINWRGMQQSGGRRIKRAIHIDMTTVKFCTAEMIEKFKKIKILRPYIEAKLEELKLHNEKNEIDESIKVNGRRMTNLGTFRKYIESYLRNHPKINQNMTLLIRQLNPGETGMPIEIYVFSSVKEWISYEAIQSDIFDHILSVIPEFELSVFQNPSGNDFKQMLTNSETK